MNYERRQDQCFVDQLKRNLVKLNLTILWHVPADGNCFFHSIADQLERLGISQQHNVPSLRHDVVNYLRNLVGTRLLFYQ